MTQAKKCDQIRRNRRRIAAEKSICRATIRALHKAGYALTVDYSDNDNPKPGMTERAIMALLFNLDDAFLAVYEKPTDELPTAWVRFVFGNDGWDVICDYTTNLENIIGENSAVEAVAEKWEARLT